MNLITKTSYSFQNVLLDFFTSSAVVLIEDTIKIDAGDTAISGDIFQFWFFSAESMLHIIESFHNETSMSDTESSMDSLREIEYISDLTRLIL